MSKKQFERPLAQNRKASHDYFIEEKYDNENCKGKAV